MPRAFRPLLLLVLAIAVAAPALLAQSDRPAKGWFRCDTNTGGGTIYATPFFDWTGTFDELQNAFQQHLSSRYGYKERVSCSMASPNGNTLANLQADMQRQYTQFRAQGRKVVEIPWTITAPGVSLAYGCFGVAQVRRAGMPDSTYLLTSKVFRIQPGTVRELYLAWVDELNRLHPGWYFQSPGCNLLPADPADHKDFYDRTAAMYERFKPRITQLDWAYRPGAAAETAEEDRKPAYYCERISGSSKTVYMTPVRPADSAWDRWDIQNAWQTYVQASLDKQALTGGCEAGTLKQETVVRNGRREQWINQGYSVRDVDWTYAPGARPGPAPAPAPAPAPPPAAPPAAVADLLLPVSRTRPGRREMSALSERAVHDRDFPGRGAERLEGVHRVDLSSHGARQSHVRHRARRLGPAGGDDEVLQPADPARHPEGGERGVETVTDWNRVPCRWARRFHR